MKSSVWLKLSAIAVGTVLTTSACADNNISMVSAGFALVEPPDCTAKAALGGAMIGKITLDVSLPSSASTALIVLDQMVARSAKNLVRAESNNITVTSVLLHYYSVPDEVTFLPEERKVATGAVIIPNASDGAGIGTVPVEFLSGEDMNSFKSVFTEAGQSVSFTVGAAPVGETGGGHSLTGSELTISVKVCRGCLAQQGADYNSPTGTCDVPPDDYVTCEFGVNEYYPCSLCPDSEMAFCNPQP